MTALLCGSLYIDHEGSEALEDIMFSKWSIIDISDRFNTDDELLVVIESSKLSADCMVVSRVAFFGIRWNADIQQMEKVYRADCGDEYRSAHRDAAYPFRIAIKSS